MSSTMLAKRRMANTADSIANTVGCLSIFPTEIGWMGITGNRDVVTSVTVGHSSAASVKSAVRRWQAETDVTDMLQEFDWHPDLRIALQDYAQGIPVDFAEFKLQLPQRTPFRDKVLAVTRRLRYGDTTTYGQLARDVGHPGAARAVGTVMSTNRFPIVIPCHRVLAAGGKLGGYTSPAGTDLKQRLLDMEQSA